MIDIIKIIFEGSVLVFEMVFLDGMIFEREEISNALS